MAKLEYTDDNGETYTLDLTSPTSKELDDFYINYIRQHDKTEE
tara:strand:+ start:279 stop:407 length:129 start_codon:yes stop_codon:yes gene_type:complete